MAERDPSEEAVKLPWAPCMAYELEESDTAAGGAGAPFYASLRWNKDELKIHFIPNKVLPSWTLMNKAKTPITNAKVLEWANGWSSEALGLKGIVPQFVEEKDIDESDIRVQFTATDGSKSHIGMKARDYEGEATIWLNLAAPHDDYREYLVLHEFGHVLGLGHEHQMSHLARALDEKATIAWLMRKCNMDKESARSKFMIDYQGYSRDETPEEGSKFDPRSVMCYPIALECIGDKQRFTPEELKAITRRKYNRRKVLSDVDLLTITNLYSTDSNGVPLKKYNCPKRAQGGVISQLPPGGFSIDTPPSSDDES